jgi:hypothetical protein
MILLAIRADREFATELVVKRCEKHRQPFRKLALGRPRILRTDIATYASEHLRERQARGRTRIVAHERPPGDSPFVRLRWMMVYPILCTPTYTSFSKVHSKRDREFAAG